MKIKILFLILALCISDAEVSDWSETPTQNTHYKLYYSAKLKTSKWIGYPDPNYVWDSERMSYEREVTDEDGKKRTVKTYKEPIEIIADFKPETKVSLTSPEIERAAPEKFGGGLKGFVWLDNISGGGEVVLPFIAPHIFIATGDKTNPTLTEIFMDPNEDNYYEVIEGKTCVFVKSFSGIGGAAGTPSTLIAHYKLNDDLATAVIVDETGDHNGIVKDTAGTATSAFHSVTGKIIRAQDFDGTDDHIEIPDDDAYTPAGTPLSISAWVYMHDATDFTIASKYQTAKYEWIFHCVSSKLYNYYYDLSETAYIGRSFNTVMTSYENQWVHLVATSDGGILSSGVRIYINGVRSDDIDFKAGTFVAVENLTQPVWLGRSKDGYSDGLIDDVMIFSVELTLREVNFLYNYGMGRENWVHPMPLQLGTNF